MKFILDENLPERIAHGFKFFGKELYSTKDVFGCGVPDPELLPKIAEENFVLITKDNMHKNPVERAIIKQFGITIFRIPKSKAKKRKFWDYVVLFVNRWHDIERAVENTKMPFEAIIKLSKIVIEKQNSSYSPRYDN